MSKKIGFRSYQNDEEPDKQDELEKQQAERQKAIRFQRCRKLADLHRLPHGKQHGLHNGLLLFQIFHSHSFSSTVVFSYSYW